MRNVSLIVERNDMEHSRVSKTVSTMHRAHYIESDLGRAALLKTIGYPLVGLRHIAEGRIGFEFRDEQGTAARDAENYYSATVPAHEIVESLRILKRALALEREHQKHEHREACFSPAGRHNG